MSRLLSTLRWETTIQWRQGIFYAAAFVAIVWTALLAPIPDAGIEPVLVSVLFLDLSIFGFFFMAALYYLEKTDRVLEGLVVTPLRVGEYLAAKIATLTLLSMAVGAVVTLLTYGAALNWFWYVVAVAAMSVPLILLGFVLAACYRSINEFLVPSIFYLGLMQVPLLGYLGVWENPLLYLLPSTPGLVLLEAAFAVVAWWEIGYALLYALALAWIGAWWAQRTFENVITRQVGD